MTDRMRSFTPPSLEAARITGGFWAERQKVNREVTIPYVLDKCDETGRTQSLRLEWKPGAEWEPHQFYDSDLAKAVEAAAYSLHQHPDPELEARVSSYVDLFVRAQQPDGYLNSYYTQTGLEDRWSNLRDMHELYCAGHIFEAAVAHYRATGKRTLLDAAVRLADHIDARFGPADAVAPGGGKEPGHPGHEEIELALVKLGEVTGEQRYLDLARFFVDERGAEPHYFRVEADRRGEPETKRRWEHDDHPAPYAYYQAHTPVREQEAAEGHSVRACYLYAGMVDVARGSGDESLLAACRRLFDNIAERRMYVTGGIGSHAHGERFTVDYDLPNESAYAETCAAISLVFFASRLANADLDSRYADVAERALYNGVLSGLSRSGDRFFYANPLSYHPTAPLLDHVRSDSERQPWYGCACCPPNIARMLASLSSYVYATSDDIVAVHLYAESSLEFQIDGTVATLRQATNYPWDGEIAFTCEAAKPVAFTLALRVPGWAKEYTLVTPEGSNAATLERGYLFVRREWAPGDTVTLSLPMQPRRTYAHPAVRQDGRQVALERGPIVYCIEGADNGAELSSVALPADAPLAAAFEPDVLGGCAVIRATGTRRGYVSSTGTLYGEAGALTPAPLTAIPYALWNNRGSGEMRVWIAEG